MEHFAPHPSSKFEGFYSKFDLPSGAHVALIICSVPNAPTRPHMVSFTYYPVNGTPIFQREHWVASIERITTGLDNAFEVRIPELGYMRTEQDGTSTYSLETDDWSLEAMSARITPWSKTKDTPEGWMIRLPLPLHWHVHSFASPCAFQLDIPSLKLPCEDKKGRASIHQEKNWANSFPAAHMWIQAWDTEREHGVCLAGGKILGMTAYMLGYRSKDVNVDFVPPFALALAFLSPFMTVDIDYEGRSFCINVSNFFRKIVLRARAPKDKGWIKLGCPFPEGHRFNFCTESFLATVEVEVYERRGWWPWAGWQEIRREKFENASLEFAGEYYPDRGEKRG